MQAFWNWCIDKAADLAQKFYLGLQKLGEVLIPLKHQIGEWLENIGR